MKRRIVVIEGHPDPDAARLSRALADHYAQGAADAGHEVRRIRVAELEFPLLRTQADFEHGTPPGVIAHAQLHLEWADHWVLLYPLWLGEMPALLKGFLEQTCRPNFAFRYREKGLPEKLMKGRSARIVVTMGMPAFAYRFFYCAHSVRSLRRNILGFTGIGPIGTTYIGSIGAMPPARSQALLRDMERLGAAGI